jgi:transcriptional regulator with XRE-family HTH domain/energy-coupling factor transporter ATP-binding protein EcfA2
VQYNTLLKQAREERGWSQKDVAEKIGTDSKTVSRWERRVAYPSPYFRQKLSNLFEKNLRELDLLTSGERELENGNPPITSKPPEAPVVGEQPSEPPDAYVDATSQPPAASLPSRQQTRAAGLRLQNRARMLDRLRRSYDELLEYSLQNIVRIELGLAKVPNAVQNATNRLVRLSQEDAQTLPLGTSILEVYEMSGYELLILGEPGAGKSTMLLHLARLLIQQAEQEEAHPLPVVLRLSSWAEKKPALEDWMSEQLALTYDVSRKLSTQWVHDEQILPLLDGLDEMDAAARSACIAAINAYHREHLLVPLVICSRRTEYEAAASQQKLALQHAVLIQPLTLEQVYAALDQIGHPLNALRQTLRTNLALQELTATPLQLSILLLAYSRTPVPAFSHELPTLQKQMWTDYVAHMVGQKGAVGRYSLQQTCLWLSWLARNLQKHYQTVFYLEHVQADWLPENLRQRAFRLTMRLPIILLSVVASCIIGLFLQTVFDLTTGLQAAVLGCVLASCFSQTASVSSPTTTAAQSRGCTLGKGLVSVCTGLVVAGSFGFEVGPGYGSGDWLRDGLIYGGIIGFACWSLLVLFPLLASQRRAPHTLRAAARLHHMLSTPHLRRALSGATALGLAYGLSTGLSYGASYGPSTGLNFLLSYGCVIFLISLIVEKNRGNIGLTERLRWSRSSFFHSLRSFEHCVASGALGLSLLLVVGLSYGLTTGLGLPVSTDLGFRLSYGLSDGLTSGLSGGPITGLTYGLTMGLIVGAGIGLAYWLALGLFQSIAQERIEDQDRQSLNQGVRRSMRNSIIIGLLSAGVVGGLGFMGDWLSYLLNEGLSKGLIEGLGQGLGYALSSVWIFAIGGGLVGWAVCGGWAVLQHFALRWLLHRGHIFPWQAQAFLDNATACILLQRVGGGYSFIHRLLLEHFANLDDGNVPATVSATSDSFTGEILFAADAR